MERKGERKEKKGREGREKEGEGGRKEGRPTYGDAVVAREPDGYKLPHKEAKSCWEGKTRGGMHRGGEERAYIGRVQGKVRRTKREEREKGEGKSLETTNRVCTFH